MISLGEIARVVQGTWELFLGRPGAERRFDTSFDGFWRSFQAIVVIAPLYVFVMLVEYGLFVAGDMTAMSYFWEGIVTLAVDWVTLPIVLGLLAGFLGFSRTYAPFIAVRNWSSILIMGTLAVYAVIELALFGLLGADVLLGRYVLLAATMRLLYVAARRVLGVGAGLAAGIMVLDVALSLFIATFIGRIFGSI